MNIYGPHPAYVWNKVKSVQGRARLFHAWQDGVPLCRLPSIVNEAPVPTSRAGRIRTPVRACQMCLQSVQAGPNAHGRYQPMSIGVVKQRLARGFPAGGRHA